MEEVRRTGDDELCGLVATRDGQWCALTVFGAELGRHDSHDAAVAQVLDEGLTSLTERWTLRDAATGEEEVVCLQEVSSTAVTVALGYYALPGEPTQTITAEQLAAGEWELMR
jgi:hypothetical protein